MIGFRLPLEVMFVPDRTPEDSTERTGTFMLTLGSMPVLTQEKLPMNGMAIDAAARFYTELLIADMLRDTAYCACPDRPLP